jgi:putative oxidoreductase
MMNAQSPIDRVPQALLVLRVTLALFFAQWGVEKFVKPEAAASIFDHFYGLHISALVSYLFGAVEVVLAAALLLGIAKTITYGALIALHGVSVAVSWRQLLHPWGAPANHLFIASVPLLGALVALFLLRERDTLSLAPGAMRRLAGAGAPKER